MYKRKTVDCYAIEGFYEGYGWDIECNCEDYKDAKVQLKTYRENVFMCTMQFMYMTFEYTGDRRQQRQSPAMY